jgi:hypothetical protein
MQNFDKGIQKKKIRKIQNLNQKVLVWLIISEKEESSFFNGGLAFKKEVSRFITNTTKWFLALIALHETYF